MTTPRPHGIPPNGLHALVERLLGDRYEILGEVGRGAMGIVYRAKDRTLLRTVAIKVLPPELGLAPGAKERFLREARIASNLSHPNIVDIYTVEEIEPLVFFVMRFVEGTTFEQDLAARGQLDFVTARRILTEIAEALAYAHRQQVVHRDIKPENILIDRDSHPMVTDFGVARALTDDSARLTAAGRTFGTPLYMSPEQARGDPDIDGRSDLYSLGVVAYRMLAGELPFTGTDAQAVFIQHLCIDPPPITARRPDVPPAFEWIVMTLLAKDRRARFNSATQLAAELSRALEGTAGVRFVPPLLPGTMHATPGMALAPHSTARVMQRGEPTPEERARWTDPVVRAFRSQLAFHAWTGAGLGVLRLISGVAFVDLLATIWLLSLTVRSGLFFMKDFGWRDVLRQPRSRSVMEMARHPVSLIRGIFNLAEATVQPDGRYAQQLLAAASNRDEIIRAVQRMTPAQRAEIPGVEETARRLVVTMQAIAGSLAATARAPAPGEAERSNALDAKLAECADALQSIKLDVLRLGAGSQETTGVTTLTMRAMSLAQNIDAVLYAAAEIRRELM